MSRERRRLAAAVDTPRKRERERERDKTNDCTDLLAYSDTLRNCQKCHSKRCVTVTSRFLRMVNKVSL